MKNILAKLAPYKDILLFMVALLAANYFWKLTVRGDEMIGAQAASVTWLGIDLTAPFDFMVRHIASVCYRIIRIFSPAAYLVNDHSIYFSNGGSISVIWGCTAIKQSFIFLIIMLVAEGNWRRKLWFVPLGLLLIYAFNIFRITVIALLVEGHPQWFNFLHTYLFKYVFYGVIFLYWVWWTEKIGGTRHAVAQQEEDI